MRETNDVFQYITNDKFNIIDTHNSKAKLLRFFDHSVHPPGFLDIFIKKIKKI